MSGRRERRLQKRERARIRVGKGTPRERVVTLSAEGTEALSTLREMFRAKFGREPGPNDPIFFDPDSDTPRPMNEQKFTKDTISAMVKAGIEPAKIYAFQKTGLLPTEDTWNKLLPEDRLAWEEAIGEYDRLTKQKH